MTDNEVFFDELSRAIGMLRRAFLRRGLTAPKAIELGDHRAVDHFRLCMPRDLIMAQPAMGPDRTDIVFHVQGLEVRGPAQFRARERGGFDIE